MSSHKKDVGAICHDNGVGFRVWAPFAKSVAVTGTFNDWSKTDMQSENDGYWTVDFKGAEAGQEYKFIIDTGSQELHKNDPRALHVTLADGNSVIVETNFNWTDDKFIARPLNQQVVYEVYVGTFNRVDASSPGTFTTLTQKLDYLVKLGVTTIELMPITVSSEDETWGPYTTTYLFAIETLFGSRHDFMEFVNAAHKVGIGVVLDVVYNHLGPGDLDMWQFDGWSEDNKGGIYFYNGWRSHTPWGDTRLDYGRDEVRQLILDNVKMWMHDCHVDGLRLDSTGFIRTVNGHNNDPSDDIPEGWSILQQITELAKKINPAAFMIAEDLGGNEYITKTTGEGGAGFSSQWEVGLPHVFRDTLDSTDDAYRQLMELSNILGRRYNGDAFQRIIYSDSHDSASNGAARLNEEIAPGNATSLYARKRSLIAAAMVLTAPGIPMLFQGQEFMQGGSFNGWKALEWNKADKFAGIVTAHEHLIALRKNQYGHTAGLTGQSVAILHQNDNDKVLAYHRWENGGPGDDVVVVINFANKAQPNYSLKFPRDGAWEVRFNSDWKGYSPDFKDTPASDINVSDNTATLALAPYSVLIFSQQTE